MRGLRAYFAVALLALAIPATAQDSDSDRGFLTDLIESKISGVGREVRLQGFAGALSSRATIEELTIADAEGVWLTIRDAAISWNRSALLRGRVEIAELSAREIEVARKPVASGEPGLPDPGAPAFALPDLPVSVEIGSITAETTILGAPLLGEEIRVSLAGRVLLAGGEGKANLVIERIDDKEGALTLNAAFVGATEVLTIALALSEPQDGIAATMLNLPGRPAMDLKIEGDGPLTDFAARITLASDGVERLSGALSLTAEPVDATVERRFGLDLAGDLAPLFLPQYQEFFGSDVRLVARGTHAEGGRTKLDTLSVSAASLALDGSLTLAADGLPEAFALTGRIAAPDGAPVTLPMAGPVTEVAEVLLDLGFDATNGDAWQGSLVLRGLQREADSIDRASLNAEGTIARRGAYGAGRKVSAEVALDADGIALGNAALAEALGVRVTARSVVNWTEGAPIELASAVIETDTARLAAAGSIGALADGLPFTVKGSADLPDLSAFSTLAARPLGGRVVVALNGMTTLLDGRFDMRAGGTGRNLTLGIAPLDRAIAGESKFGIDARRDEAGITLRRFEITTNATAVSASGLVQTGVTSLTARAELKELALVLPELSGPASLRATIREGELGRYDIMAVGAGPGGALLELAGKLTEDATGAVSTDGTLKAQIATLAPYSGLAGRELGGSADLELTGQAALAEGAFDIKLDLVGTDLAASQPTLDAILRGQSRLTASARRDADGIALQYLNVTTPASQLSASGLVKPGATTLTASARLGDARVAIPGLTGTAGLDASITETAPGTYDIAATGTGPGGAALDFAGQVTQGAGDALSADGRLTAKVAELAAYAELTGQKLGGSADLEITGQAALPEKSFDVVLNLNGRDLAIGQPTADTILRGASSLAASARRDGEITTIRQFALTTPELTASLTGAVGDTAGEITGEARLRNAGILAPDFPGPLTLRGTLNRTPEGRWGTDIRAEGPGNTTANISGTVASDAKTVDLKLTGEAPLGLANASIAPRAVRGRANFDLAMNGAPGLPALSGRITTSGARLVAPTYGVAVSEIGGGVTLGGSRATLDISGAVEGGGRVGVSGTVGLDAPNQADLRIALTRAKFTDPTLFETEVDGAITVTGPLQGGARIGGTIDIGTTEIRLAATGGGTGDDVEGLRHLNEPAATRQTRARAGFLEVSSGATGGGRRPFALDLLVRAPNRIFLRGRGLDAELGGQLRLVGTTAAVIPQGQFDLLRGRLDILGRRLALDEGFARLEGSFDPYVRLVATSEADGITVRIVVEGMASEPEIRFESSPELPEDEVLARLFFGRSISELSPLQAARLASAVAQLAGGGGTDVVDRLRQNFGLDELDVTTDSGGNAAVRAGRYISENIYSEVSVGSEGTADISINLDLSPSLTVKGSVGSDGGTGLGVFFERDY